MTVYRDYSLKLIIVLRGHHLKRNSRTITHCIYLVFLCQSLSLISFDACPYLVKDSLVQLNPIFSTVKKVRAPLASPRRVPKLFVKGSPPLLACEAEDRSRVMSGFNRILQLDRGRHNSKYIDHHSSH